MDWTAWLLCGKSDWNMREARGVDGRSDAAVQTESGFLPCPVAVAVSVSCQSVPMALPISTVRDRLIVIVYP